MFLSHPIERTIKMIKPLLTITACTLLVLTASPTFADDHAMASPKAAIEKAVNNNAFRTELDIERDQYRNPVETLDFFGIEPHMTVAEVGPGGGWYTRILAPLTAENGKYIALNGVPAEGERYERGMQWRESFIDHESGMFGPRAVARFLNQNVPFAAPNSVDAVLVIRGMHGRIARGGAPELLAEAYSALKPGGVLGIVQHRELEDFDTDPTTTMRGYVKQSFIIDLVTGAGFELADTSEINANPKDTTQWERGVWSLQAGTPIAEKDAKFREIGESDRMTLKFVKPAE
jgi:predicted methyltransferase